ncbi:transcriptional regulator [Enterobacterales bacterium CwR94]|nr:transcriptional regulator [Enterobacterales bacterium CwR94]
MKTLEEMIAQRSAESQVRIADKALALMMDVELSRLRESCKLTQSEVARRMGIAQPSVKAIESRGNEIKISTLKRYIEAMGGKMTVNVDLPDGKKVAFSL